MINRTKTVTKWTPASQELVDAVLDTARKTLAITTKFPQLKPLTDELRDSIATLEKRAETP